MSFSSFYPAQRTREEYSTTLKKWARWGNGVSVEQLGRKEIREFLDGVYEDAAGRLGGNPGRTANKVRSHLRAVMSWAWEQDLVAALPRFPKVKPQRDVAGRHYLTKAEINALYFATHQMKPDETAAQLEAGIPRRSVLEVCVSVFLQLRSGHGHDLENRGIPRADTVAARVVGPTFTRPRSQRDVSLGLAVLPPGKN